MSFISRYGPATHILIINKRKIANWSSDDEPCQIETMEDLRDIEIHHGGGTVITDRVSEGALLRVMIQPGTPDSGWFAGIYKSGTILEAELVTVGTGEKITLSGGVATKFGDLGRGFKPSNDNYEMKFGTFIPVMGNA